MARRITIYGNINIYPTVKRGENGEPEEGKDIVITDLDSGTDYVYPMSLKLAEEIGRDLKMNNKSLVAKIQDKQERMAARQMLAGGNGAALPEDILRGVHQKDNPT